MGRYGDLMRLAVDFYNERGNELFTDPDLLEAARTWISPDVECTVPSNAAMPGRYTGFDGWVRFQREWHEQFSDIKYTLLELEEKGSVVTARVRYAGRGITSGAPFEDELQWRQEYRDGKLVRFVVEDAV